MPEVPACLNRRYRALDNLIRELDSSSLNSIEPPSDSSNVGIRLMCDFWNILKDDPDCNLTQEVQQCMGLTTQRTESIGNIFGMQRYITYRGCCEEGKGKDKKGPSKSPTQPSARSAPASSAASAPPPTAAPIPGPCSDIPLSKVLCNLKEAASFDQKCHVRVKELMKAQEELRNQIQILEQRESAGVELLKQADEMWLCMEEAYKTRVSESLLRQKDLLKELKEVEDSANKWRKNERDLEFQIKNMVKIKMEIIENMHQKENDIKVMDTEIANFQKRIESNTKDLEGTQRSLISKREASDARLASIAREIHKVQQKTQQEIKRKRDKEDEGAQYVKDARDDLQKICKVLLQKKIEHEDLRAERKAILEELELLHITADNCKEKCKNKENSMKEEIKALTKEIAAYKVKCIKCHVCTDTDDVRKLCTDCPKCLEERQCLYGDDTCAVDPTWDCVCMGVKQKFLDNIFDNMYTVLERKSKTPPGKAVADAVLNCLKKSTNGKLNAETRKILQEFVLTTVKKNLNLTIVGGAVKTRCEMDPETYKQLMLCLNRVEPPKAIKQDKGTSKKEPCPQWTRSVECHCPKGPKDCICKKKAPPAPDDPAPCPPQDPEDAGETTICPQKGKVCGPDCGMQGKPPPGSDPKEIATWRPDPCSGPSCSYSKTTKPTQYVIGTETRGTVTPTVKPGDKPIVKPSPINIHTKPAVKSSPMYSRPSKRASPVKPTVRASPTCVSNRSSVRHSPMRLSNRPSAKNSPVRVPDNLVDFMASCMCTGSVRKPCPCQRDRRMLPRERIIEEVMGKYNDLPPIAKVGRSRASNISSDLSRCECFSPVQYFVSKQNQLSPFCGCSPSYKTITGRVPVVKKSSRRRSSKSCKCGNYRNTVRCGNMAMLAAINNKTTFKCKTVDRASYNDIKELVCPKFAKTQDSKIVVPLESSMHFICASPMSLKNDMSQNISQDIISDKAHGIERNVCDTVKELIKDVIVDPEELKKNNLSSDVEWITVDKLFEKVKSLTKLEHYSNSTVNETEMRNAKHLKAKSGPCFDKCKCTQQLETPVKDMVCKLPCFNKKTKGSDIIQSREVKTNKNITASDKFDTYTTPTQEMVSRHFIITFLNKGGLPCTQFTALAKTKSGKLVMELDEQLIEVIENRAKDSPFLFVSLKKTDSGHLVVEFDANNDDASNIQEVTVKQTPSGANLLVMPKNLLNIIQDTEQNIPSIYSKNTDNNMQDNNKACPHCSHISTKGNSEQNNKLKLLLKKNMKGAKDINNWSPINVELVKINKTRNATLGESSVEQLYNHDSYGKIEPCNSLVSQKTTISASLTSGISKGYENVLQDYSLELQNLYDSGKVDLILMIEAKSHIINKLQTVIFKSPSGTIGINMEKSCLTPFDANYPVCLSKTISGNYLVDLDQGIQIYNGVLKKTLSGHIMLVPTQPQIIQVPESETNSSSAREKFYKIKVVGLKNVPLELPGVLKLTPSENYLIILDKEFEKRYRETVNTYIGEQRKCFVYLEKTPSGFLLDPNSSGCIPPENLNALLVKSPTGHIKVVVHGTVFECIDSMTPRRSSMSSVKIFGKLLETLQPILSEKKKSEVPKVKSIKSKLVNQKASSDTQLYERVKVQLQVDKNLFTEPSAILKKTDSGQYAVILKKESKKTFINNLRSYLSNNPKGLIPVKRTSSGQILIVLNKDLEDKGHFGSLKITSSGNIYIIVSEESIRKMTDKNKPTNADSSRSGKPVVGVDKAVTTTCNARPNECDCDTSKCVCAELEYEGTDWLDHRNVIKRDSSGRPREPMCWMKPRRDSRTKCPQGCYTTINRVTITPKDTSPYIVIKPASESRPCSKTIKSTEHYVDTVCPYHKDRYNGVSNELLEISGMCNKPQEAPKNKIEFTSNSMNVGLFRDEPDTWDSLNYLPPQLPPFLNSVSYR